jgi:hypothetical protein
VSGFVVGDRVQMRDANGVIIRGRVNRVIGHGIGVVFQRGWVWPDGAKEPRSAFSWHFPPSLTLNGERSMVLTKAERPGQ